MNIIKRDGQSVEFDINKIISAISKANAEVNETSRISQRWIVAIAEDIKDQCEESFEDVTVEDIQDMVENKLIKYGATVVAKAYITYRFKRMLARQGNTTDKTIFELVAGDNDYWNTENSNKDAKTVTTQRDYIAGITSTDIARRFIFTNAQVAGHDEGLWQIHDMDYMAQNALNNCCLINLEDMLQNGTVINGVRINKPKKFITACTIATQIILGVSSSQYGGCTVSLTHLAPFVRLSFLKYLKNSTKFIARMDDYMDKVCLGEKDFPGYDFVKENYPKNYEYAMDELKSEINSGVQTFNYQVNSMTTTNGQAPFVSVFMYLNETQEYKEELAMVIEEFLLQRIQGFQNESGVWITPAFPKLLYTLEEDNIYEDSKYWYLTELSAKCSAKRLVPDYISEKIMKSYKVDDNGDGQCFPCMGCRSFLSPYLDENNKPKYYGRFNCGVCTISLPDVALSSKKNEEEFWKIFDERLEMCHDILKIRYQKIEAITSEAAPILWRYGAFARLGKGESVKKLVHGGYATVSLGYAGLYECVKYMTGKSHTDDEAKDFAIRVMQYMNDKCEQWKAEEDVAYSVYGTPIESTTYKFAKALRERFGEIEGITDKNYITNSYHVHVTEEIDAFKKLKFESEFQKLSPGGSISYVELPNLQHNIPAVLEIIKYIYDNIMYAELNSKSDYCQVCGFDGEIQIVTKEDGKLDWKCPNCGNMDHNKLNVARRTCGYIGTNFWNQGRTQEIKERVLHVSINETKLD